MKKHEKYLIAAAALIALMLMPGIVNPTSMTPEQLIASFEGFSAHPYWDVIRWSWGYGTPAPGATGTITKDEALQELKAHSQNDYDYLSPLITRPLTGNQWAAFLSFAYNEGPGNADNLVQNINSADNDALTAQWRLYNKARDINGNLVYNANLTARREKELQIWFT